MLKRFSTTVFLTLVFLSLAFTPGPFTNVVHAADRAIAEKLAVFWPNQHDRGTHINISGAGVTKSSKNKENAIKLIEFLTTDESQKWYAEANFEYPVKSGVPKSRVLVAWGEFKADDINLAALGKNNAGAVKIMDRAGWK